MPYLRIARLLIALPVVTALAITILFAQPAHAADADYADLIGTWRLTKVLDSSEISALDDRQAARLVGKVLLVERDKVSLAGETCKEPDFKHHYEDTVRYLREEAHAASGKLGLPEIVEIIDLACTEVLRKSHDKVVLYWKGFFFDAVKQNATTVE